MNGPFILRYIFLNKNLISPVIKKVKIYNICEADFASLDNIIILKINKINSYIYVMLML